MTVDTTPEPVPHLTRQEELQLLLADMTMPALPPTFFSAPGPGAEQLTDDITPERVAAWLDREAKRLRLTTGMDLFPGEESNPESSEEETA